MYLIYIGRLKGNIMRGTFDPLISFEKSKQLVGYIRRNKTKPEVYKKMGFKSGLEVHQQLRTEKKLFCRCPAGIYQKGGSYDAEVVRHMRPTLSELGEYDGTALMEFKTKKEIVYRIANTTACTYDIDDTPPFKLNREALKIATEIALLLKANIVGELHITRKQYLDGSIPTGFQRTAIVGIDGAIPLSNKKVKILQISIEEDSCREVSDVGHQRIFTTDRLGIPLIEIVTAPDLKTPDEAAEAANYIRFLTRSTCKVRTGIGAAREDVNVSVNGGTRIEIKGVAHISHIKDLTHNEAFRQKSLLLIRDELGKKIHDQKRWKMESIDFDVDKFHSTLPEIRHAIKRGYRFKAINLSGFSAILSFFTQPGRMFADEICDRLKVIACIEKPNMIHSEHWHYNDVNKEFKSIRRLFKAKEEDAQIIVWGPEQDIPLALETIEERCRLAFSGVPNETRKALPDRTTIFERVLPGPNRMYPDTDSVPIPIGDAYIQEIVVQLPKDVSKRFEQLHEWGIPEDAFSFLLRNNLIPLIERIVTEFNYKADFVGTLLSHRLKNLMGKIKCPAGFNFEKIYDLFAFTYNNKLELDIIKFMLPVFYLYPDLDLQAVLTEIGFKRYSRKQILSKIPRHRKEYRKIRTSRSTFSECKWMMKRMLIYAVGNISLAQLSEIINKEVASAG